MTPFSIGQHLNSAGMNVEELMVLQLSLLSIYLNNDSAFCARLSCGSTIEICKEVASGRIRNGFAIVRPPGHHAEPGMCDKDYYLLFSHFTRRGSRILSLQQCRNCDALCTERVPRYQEGDDIGLGCPSRQWNSTSFL